MFSTRNSVLVALALICFLLTPLFGQEQTGAINGAVTDQTGGVLPGVTVTATNNVTGRSVTTITESDGIYRFRTVPPGRYKVTFSLTGFSTAEFSSVIVLLGETVKLDVKMAVGGVTQEVAVTAAAVLIDTQSSSVSHNITAEEFDRLPKGRSFQGVATTSPSVNSGVDQFGTIVGIEGGLQINGASSAENQFFIDGVATNSQLYGQSRQDSPFEFLQEVQVKTGGTEAEYGGALGGVMSASTKSGGNEFHGEAHYYFAGDAIADVGGATNPYTARRRLLNPLTVGGSGFNNGLGGYVEDASPSDKRNEFGGSVGGPIKGGRIPPNKAWFYISASPQIRRRSVFYNLNDGPDTVDVKQLYQHAFAKISYDPTPRIRTNVSWLWSPTISTGAPLAYNTGPNGYNITKAANQVNKDHGFFQPQTNYTGNVEFTLGQRSLLNVRGGRFWDNFKESGIPKITQVEYQNSTSDLSPALLATIPANMQGGLGFNNTPRLKLVDHDLVARSFVNADYSINGNWFGSHDFKTGWGVSKAVNNVDNSYPNGGYVFVFWGQAFTSSVVGAPCSLNPCSGTYGYYEVDDNGTKGSTGGTIQSLYWQDKWTINRRLTLSLGLRLENEKVPSFRRAVLDPAFKFGFSDKIMPRLGFSYDLLGDGKVKVAASWGRFYDWVKYELARGTFGGDIWTTKYRALDTPNVFSLSAQNMPGRDLWDERTPNSYQDHRIPSFSKDCSAQNLSTCQIDPSLKPQGTDLINASVEYQWGAHTVVRAGYVRNNLLQAIEDMGVLINGSENYLYVNPGKGFLGNVMNINPGVTATKAPDTLCQSRLTGNDLANCLAGKVFPTPKAVRTYNAMELSVTRRFAQGWFLDGSYVLSRLYGNYPGIANADEIRTPTVGSAYGPGQQQSSQITRQGTSASRAWDLDQIMFDSKGHLDILGLLPTDRTHALKLYGSYNFRFGTEIGSFFNVSSGTPITTYAYTVQRIPMRVNGRGDLGRTPVLSQTDLLVAHTVKLGESKQLRFEFNMNNLFNQKAARHIYNCANPDCINGLVPAGMNLAGVNLFQGFDYQAKIAASSNGQAGQIAFDPRYKKEDLFNPGFAGRFGVKFTF